MSFKEMYNSQRLIAEIKKRRGLYDPTLPVYSDKIRKTKLWLEVCEVVVTNWRELTKEEKALKARDIQRRWKSLRDCFKREIQFQEKLRLGESGRKRKYLYYDALSFLMPTVASVPGSVSSVNSSDYIEEELEVEPLRNPRPAPQPPSSSTVVGQQSEPTPHQVLQIPQKPRQEVVRRHEEIILSVNANPEEAIDDDKAFLVSLLPMMRKFNDEQKFAVRMEFMNTMRQVQLGQYSHMAACWPQRSSFGQPRPSTSSLASNSANSANNTFGLAAENGDAMDVIDIKEEELIADGEN